IRAGTPTRRPCRCPRRSRWGHRRHAPCTQLDERWTETMISSQLTKLEEFETEGILRWRFTQLMSAGFTSDDALELATRIEVDLPQATDLRRRGCPSETAKRILL